MTAFEELEAAAGLSSLALGIATITALFLAYYFLLSDQRRIEVSLQRQGIPAQYKYSIPFVGHVEQFFDLQRLQLDHFEERPNQPPLSYFSLFGNVPLTISDPTLSTELWATQVNWDKSEVFYAIIDMLFGTSRKTLITHLSIHDQEWQCKRELVGQAFRNKETLRQLSSYIEALVKELCDEWCRHCSEESAPIDVDFDLTALTLRVICYFVFGAKVDKARVQPLQAALQGVVDLAWTINTNPLMAIHQMIPGTHAYQISQSFRNCVREFIQEAKMQQQAIESMEYQPLIYSLMLAQKQQHWKEEVLENEVMTLLFAGHDTTAHATTIALENCVNHPHVVEAIGQEYHDLVLQKNNNSNATEPITADCFYYKMKWPMAALKESLRLYPETAGGTVRVAPEDTTLTGGSENNGKKFVIPKGCAVISAMWTYSRSTGNWGPTVKEFCPERFLAGSNKHNHNSNSNNQHNDTSLASGCPRNFISFSQGKRNCVGMPLAYLEGSMLLGYILEHLDITIETPSKKAFKVTTRVEDLSVRVKRRNRDMEKKEDN